MALQMREGFGSAQIVEHSTCVQIVSLACIERRIPFLV